MLCVAFKWCWGGDCRARRRLGATDDQAQLTMVLEVIKGGTDSSEPELAVPPQNVLEEIRTTVADAPTFAAVVETTVNKNIMQLCATGASGCGTSVSDIQLQDTRSYTIRPTLRPTRFSERFQRNIVSSTTAIRTKLPTAVPEFVELSLLPAKPVGRGLCRAKSCFSCASSHNREQVCGLTLKQCWAECSGHHCQGVTFAEAGSSSCWGSSHCVLYTGRESITGTQVSSHHQHICYSKRSSRQFSHGAETPPQNRFQLFGGLPISKWTIVASTVLLVLNRLNGATTLHD